MFLDNLTSEELGFSSPTSLVAFDPGARVSGSILVRQSEDTRSGFDGSCVIGGLNFCSDIDDNAFVQLLFGIDGVGPIGVNSTTSNGLSFADSVLALAPGFGSASYSTDGEARGRFQDGTGWVAEGWFVRVDFDSVELRAIPAVPLPLSAALLLSGLGVFASTRAIGRRNS